MGAGLSLNGRHCKSYQCLEESHIACLQFGNPLGLTSSGLSNHITILYRLPRRTFSAQLSKISTAMRTSLLAICAIFSIGALTVPTEDIVYQSDMHVTVNKAFRKRDGCHAGQLYCNSQTTFSICAPSFNGRNVLVFLVIPLQAPLAKRRGRFVQQTMDNAPLVVHSFAGLLATHSSGAIGVD